MGIYSAREFKYYKTDTNGYAVSSYYKDGIEGAMLVDNKCTMYPSDSGYAFQPVSVIYDNKKYLFWSDFKDKWIVESTFPVVLPSVAGNLFVYSATTDNKNNIYLACEHMYAYMKSDILLLKFDGISWTISTNLNSADIFCKRPVIAVYQDTIAIMWDGYCNGYDIYLKTCKSDLWSGEIKVTDSPSWDLKPSLAYDCKGILWFAWLSNTDVERDGVISKTNYIYIASYDGYEIKNIHGANSPEVLRLDLGLLPAKRYFGYHGLRRNPQIACFKNGSVGLFWESQRDETEVWDNVENGWFLCRIYNGSWSHTYIIQDGGNCFTIDSLSLIDDVLYYAYRGTRDPVTDIKLASIDITSLTEFILPSYSEWNDWKPLNEKTKMRTDGIYWGDLHCHSIYSPDAEGYPDELFFYARDVAKIDFCAITDNDIYGDNILTASAPRYMWTLCNTLSKAEYFQAFVGYEWTYHKPNLDEPLNFNHRTIVYLDDNLTIASRADKSGFNETAFTTTLRDIDAMWHSHHGIWDILDPKHDWNVEVVSAWTNNMENFNTVHEQLDIGHKFGFMGASDNHRFIPGNGGALTGVFSKNLTKSALKESFQKRHNYVTCGSRTQLYCSIDNAQIGDLIETTSDLQHNMHIKVSSDRIIEYIDIIECGQSFSKLHVNSKEYNHKMSIPASKSERYFYIKMKLQGNDIDFEHNLSLAKGNYIYSSPIWIN